MKRFLRNVLIILIFELIASAIALLDVIPFNWKLQVMFIGGITAGAVIAYLEQRVLQTKINVLKKIRENLTVKEITIKE